MSNILILSKNLDLPEAHLYIGLEKLGLKLTIILDSSSPYKEVLSNLKSEIIMHAFNSRIDFSSIKFVRKIVLEKKIDIVHSFSNRALSNALLATIGIKVKHVAYRGTVGHLNKFDPTAWMTYLNARLNKIICVSKAVYEYLEGKGIQPTKLAQIYKGHHASWYEQSKPLELEQFGIPKGSFVIVSSANIRPVKGIDLLIEAFRALNSEPTAHLLLVGQVRDSKINELISNHPSAKRIHLTGFRNDAPRISAAGDVFCMPSRDREGLPKGVIEAMIQAVPAIVTNVGGMPELVSDGVEGYVVPPLDIKALKNALVKSFQGRAELKKMGEMARQKIIQHFTIENTINETFAVYRSLISSIAQ